MEAVEEIRREGETRLFWRTRMPTHEEIAVRAYELFLKRGLAPGAEIEDWLQAEKELVDERKPHK